MIRRNGRNLSAEFQWEEDINPMEGTGNLADAMLVLAVGMMLAVVVNWKVDFTTSGAVQKLDQAETLSESEVQEVTSNEALEEKGVVFEDPKTGELYIKVKE